MKTKYKYYIFINVCVTSTLIASLGTYLVLRNPENTYLIVGIAVLIHLSVLTLVNKLILILARKDHEVNSKSD